MTAGGDDIQFSERLLAASGSSVVAALIVNPLDVVKTRMQAQAAACSVNAIQNSTPLFELHRPWLHPAVSRWSARLPRFGLESSTQAAYDLNAGSLLSRRWAVASCPACEAEAAMDAPKLRHIRPTMWSTFRNIIQQEGTSVLWRGSHTSLMISVPMVGIYMPLYDAMLSSWTPTLGAYAPMVAGSSSRALAVACVAPLELIRTRLYASRRGEGTGILATASGVTGRAGRAGVGGGTGAVGSVMAVVRTAPQMWRGVSATLARDVPFSALYWGMLEPLRQYMLDPCRTARGGVSAEDDPDAHRQRLLVANLTAGAVAGGSAAGLTTPFDVIKTRHQITDAGRKEGVMETWGKIYRKEGLHGLFRGVGPRSARAAPACAIVIAVYELLKDALSSRRLLS